MVEHLNKNWYNKEYRIHRKQLLLDRQLAMLPDTMEAASREQDIRNLIKKNTEFTQEQKALRKKIHDLDNLKTKIQQQIYKINKESIL